MSGFPSRFTRQELGPRFRNAYPVENPETDIGDATFNALFWQAAGANLVVPRASLVANWDGAAFAIEHQAEAWNPNDAVVHPVLERESAGAYTYTFAATYKNQEDQNIATELGAPRVTVHKPLTAFADRVEGYAWRDASNPLVIHIRLWSADGTPVDEPFWLEVL